MEVEEEIIDGGTERIHQTYEHEDLNIHLCWQSASSKQLLPVPHQHSIKF